MSKKYRTEKVECQDMATIQKALSNVIIRHGGLEDAYQLIEL